LEFSLRAQRKRKTFAIFQIEIEIAVSINVIRIFTIAIEVNVVIEQLFLNCSVQIQFVGIFHARHYLGMTSSFV
jgi:hypothetical protein